MSDVYVTGHRNPDLDSIVSAMAYAALRNSLGEREYKPVRIGAVNDETIHMLSYFGFQPPEFVHNMRTQVRDLDFDRPPFLNYSVPIETAWRSMLEERISVIPIINDDGSLHGMLSAGDIASHDMLTTQDNSIEGIPLFNLVSVLDGILVNEFSNAHDTISGSINIALPKSFEDNSLFEKNSILICGNQPDVIEKALAAEISCLILCQVEVPQNLAGSTASTCIISSPLDARQASKLIYQALPVTHICMKDDIKAFHLDDYLDDVKEELLNSRHRSYPVLDENNKVVGTLARFHLLRPNRKRVVLVDHNEAAQSVSGLEQVDIIEIIDHHRLADIQTSQPISVRNEPVGSTNTIVSSMYQERGVMPSPKMAGLMAAAILSDTVMFKSPTCTKKDISMAERLARIANISLDDLGKELFSSNGSSGKSAESLFKADYKQFHIAEKNIGVSQITCIDSEPFLKRKDEFLKIMEKLKNEQGHDMIILMITDILCEGSHIIYIGNDEIMEQAFSTPVKDNHVFLPSVMSRKKQIIPMLTALWG